MFVTKVQNINSLIGPEEHNNVSTALSVLIFYSLTKMTAFDFRGVK